MMTAPLIAPDDEQLLALGLEVEEGDEPWLRSVTFFTGDDANVVVTWDTVGTSVYVAWTVDGRTVVELSRETVDAVDVTSHDDGHLVTVTSRSDGLRGVLTVEVTAAGVEVRDELLRT